jgi:hypothetical protein
VSLESIRAGIADVAGRPGTGIAVSLKNPPEKLGKVFPVSWVHPPAGRVALALDHERWTHRLELVVYVAPRIDELATEFDLIDPLLRSVSRALFAAYVDGDPAFPDPPVRKVVVTGYQVGIRVWGSAEYHAVTFEIEAEEQFP